MERQVIVPSVVAVGKQPEENVMGLFDRLANNNRVELTPKSAIALAALTVIGADGSVDDGEMDGLKRIVRGDDRAFQACKNQEIQEFIRYMFFGAEVRNAS